MPAAPLPAIAGPPPTAAECDAFAAKYCAKGVSCGAADVTMLGASCEKHVAAQCNAQGAAPGSGLTSSALVWCEDWFESTVACNDGFPGPYRLCNVLGTLPIDADCVFHAQCASGYCESGVNSCGTCAPAPNNWNVYHQELGNGCDSNQSQCNYALSLWCGFSSKTCVPIQYASAGEACLFINSNDLAFCEPGLTCKTTSSSSVGVCVAAKALGAACIDGVCAYPTAAALCK